MNPRSYFKLRSARKVLRDLCRHAGTVLKMQRDLVDDTQAEELRTAIAAAMAVQKCCPDLEKVEAATQALADTLGEGTKWKPLHPNGLAENFEVVVVALGVAMAFRCYFLQPFKIPTGSMQPTLYGIHSEEKDAPGVFDRLPLMPLKWLVTGDRYKEVRVVAGGKVYPVQRPMKDGYTSFKVAGAFYHVPNDAVQERGPKSLRGLRPDGTIAAGGVLWSGIVHTGDHLFVNRLAWNFRKPRRGEVMVFSTRNITGLPQGTHYIKRMTGLPGETISIRPPNLVVNGEPVTEPYTIGRIVRKEKLADWAPNYFGYQTIRSVDLLRGVGGFYDPSRSPYKAKTPLLTEKDAVTLADDEYFAMGDNTPNSADSRYWGAVPRENLLGPACFVYWPFTSPRFGVIH